MPGQICYQLTGHAVPAIGHTVTEDDASALSEPVKAILSDTAGIQEAQEALQDLIKTDFNLSVLEAVLAPQESYEEWRVGEALAQHHLTAQYGYDFPWPDSRSARNPNSSSGGVDLIGFTTAQGAAARFVLSEVKTSHQQAWPPSIATSRSHGLREQVTGLLGADDRSKWAIRYMTMNSLGKSWHSDFREAMSTYLAEPQKVVVVGVLVHVAKPDVKDLQANAKALSKVCDPDTVMQLVGLYPASGVLPLIVGSAVVVETAA